MPTADLTVVFLTLNELGPAWMEYQQDTLRTAADGLPVIAVSRLPMPEWDMNLLQSEPKSGWNVYRQVLRAARAVETPYIGIAEDDTLYTKSHFREFRPPEDAVAYDRARWTVLSWARRPTFGVIRKWGNFAMVGSTAAVIRALEERVLKYPGPAGGPVAGEIGRPDVESRLGVSRTPVVEWWGSHPIVNVAHPRGLSPTYIDRRGLKRSIGEIKALEIPGWGRADRITTIFNEGFHAEN